MIRGCRRFTLARVVGLATQQLRREPRRDTLSTIEAAATLLAHLEKKPEIQTAMFAGFERMLAAYRKRWNDYPRAGSVVGYTAVLAAAAAIRRAGSLDSEKLVAAMANLQVGTPFGTVTYRALDHQSTMGAYVGRIGLKDGKGVMTDWRFVDGKDALPSDAEVKKMRPAN